jgi:hypothetical protein
MFRRSGRRFADKTVRQANFGHLKPRRQRCCRPVAPVLLAQSRRTRDGRQHAEDRLDRHGAHGVPHGGAPAEEGPRRLDLESHPVEGRAAGEVGRQGRGQALRARGLRRGVLHRVDRQGPRAGLLRGSWRGARPQRQGAGRIRRLLDHRARGVRRHPVAAEGPRLGFHRLPGERQRQGDQGRQAVRSGLGAGGAVSPGRAADRGVRAERRVLRRRACARSLTT